MAINVEGFEIVSAALSAELYRQAEAGVEGNSQSDQGLTPYADREHIDPNLLDLIEKFS